MKRLICFLLGYLQFSLLQATPLDLAVGDPAIATPGPARSRLFSAHGMNVAALAEGPLRTAGNLRAGPKSTRPNELVVVTDPLASAIARAAKVGLIESSVEGYSKVLIACQKSRLTIATESLLRSDSQQAHCYRF